MKISTFTFTCSQVDKAGAQNSSEIKNASSSLGSGVRFVLHKLNSPNSNLNCTVIPFNFMFQKLFVLHCQGYVQVLQTFLPIFCDFFFTAILISRVHV